MLREGAPISGMPAATRAIACFNSAISLRTWIPASGLLSTWKKSMTVSLPNRSQSSWRSISGCCAWGPPWVETTRILASGSRCRTSLIHSLHELLLRAFTRLPHHQIDSRGGKEQLVRGPVDPLPTEIPAVRPDLGAGGRDPLP